MKRLIYLYVLILFSFYSGAQQAVLKNFNVKNGLPSNEVYYMLSDTKGFIWICTDAGLVKYNGNYFKNFNSANGLPDNTIFEVKEDRSGKIWYRSFSGKIGYILNDSVFTISANKKIEEFVKDGIISSFAIDETGDLYLGKRNSDKISFLKITQPYTEDKVSEVWKNKDTTNGIDIITIGKNDFVFSDKRGHKHPDYFANIYDNHHDLILSHKVKLSGTWLFTRVFRNKNNIYFLANKLLKKIDLNTKTVIDKDFESPLITAVPLDSNIVLTGERYRGIAYHKNNFLTEPFDHLLEGLSFTHGVKDYQNGYWFSTLESGVFYMPAQKINFVNLGSDKEEIMELTKNSDSTILSGMNTGRIIITTIHSNGQISSREIYSDLKEQLGVVHAIMPSDTKTILLSGSKGSLSLDTEYEKTNKLFNHHGISYNFKHIIKYKGGIICAALKDICAFTKDNYGQLTAFYTSYDRITSMAFDSVNNKIFIGGLRGLYEFHFQKNITEKDRLLDCRIEDIKAVSGKLYIVTNSLGLIIKNGNNYDTISEKNGLISNICKSLNIEKNTIWVSTNKGISRLTYHPDNSFEITNYPLSNFIDASSINDLTILKDKVCFYSGARLYGFETKINSGNSRFNISSLQVNGVSLNVRSYLDLSHTQSNIQISYEALFYNCNSGINYRYKMINENGSWNYTNETSINFPYLAPGEYQFLVEAKNSEDKWIPAEQSIKFKIEKPFWQKAWFLIIVILLLTGLMILIVWLRYTKILKKKLHQNSLIIKMYEMETKAIKAQMNPHFIFNSLNSIQQFILEQDNDNAYSYLSKFSVLMRKILESNTKENISLEDEIKILEGYLEIESLRFSNAFKWEIIKDEKLVAANVNIPHMMIQPFIENAIWHGLLHKKGDKELIIKFLYIDDAKFKCIIEDNGAGRDAAKKEIFINKKSLAMDFIKQRLELFGKMKKSEYTLVIKDKKDGNGNNDGTIVEIILPILD